MNAPQAAIALWLGALIVGAAAMAVNPRKPFVFALDRKRQTRVLWGMAAGGAAEALTLWMGGFWS